MDTRYTRVWLLALCFAGALLAASGVPVRDVAPTRKYARTGITRTPLDDYVDKVRRLCIVHSHAPLLCYVLTILCAAGLQL